MPVAETKIEELEKQIETLRVENIALKAKIALLYNNWNYDYKRFIDLKEETKNK